MLPFIVLHRLRKNRSKFVRRHAAEAFDFSRVIFTLLGLAFCFDAPLVYLFAWPLGVFGIFKAARGEPFKYPLDSRQLEDFLQELLHRIGDLLAVIFG